MANIKETKGETEKVCENPFEEAGSMSDVTLVVENQKLYVNKTLLSLYSPVFQRMFFSEFVEKTANEIELPDKNHDDVVNFLFQLYPVHSFRKITDETLTGILSLAEEYMVDHVRQKCQQYIQDQTSSSNKLTTDQVLLYLLLSDRCRFTELKEKLIKVAELRTPQELSQSSHYDTVDLRVMRDILFTKSLEERRHCKCWQKCFDRNQECSRREARLKAQEDHIIIVTEAKQKLEEKCDLLTSQLREITLKDWWISFKKRCRFWCMCLYLMLAFVLACAVFFLDCEVSRLLQRPNHWPFI